MLIPEKYSEVLNTKGRSLQEIGVNEIALQRPAALEAIQALRGSQMAILGGDVLRLLNGRPMYSGDNWYSEQYNSESLPDFIKRSLNVAEQYIRSYPDPEDGTVLYTLVISELGLA
ncbi:MAG: Imm40 family immunity protein [Acidobacteriota bacterium]|nr:Imm40 family immunity protein [Acidobacteriota bacterium]